MIHPVITLASSAGDILVALGVLALLAIAVVIMGTALHRSVTSNRSNDHKSSPFDLHRLRQMHEDGQLTQAEYDRAVAAVVAHEVAAANSPPANPDPTTEQQQPDPTSNPTRD